MKILIQAFIQKKNARLKKLGEKPSPLKTRNNEAGFSLIEVVCALVILLIALLGVFVTFTYSINYNAGNSSRSQALAVLQQEVELVRSKKFTPDETHPDLYGGVKADRMVTATNGNEFKVSISVDNNPLTPGVIDSINESGTTIKQITITVTLSSPTPGWQTSVPATVILQRVRGN